MEAPPTYNLLRSKLLPWVRYCSVVNLPEKVMSIDSILGMLHALPLHFSKEYIDVAAILKE